MLSNPERRMCQVLLFGKIKCDCMFIIWQSCVIKYIFKFERCANVSAKKEQVRLVRIWRRSPTGDLIAYLTSTFCAFAPILIIYKPLGRATLL